MSSCLEDLGYAHMQNGYAEQAGPVGGERQVHNIPLQCTAEVKEERGCL